MALFPGAPLPWLDLQFHDANGAPLVGGQLYSYLAGTSTPTPLYTDVDLTEAATNPVILDGSGRPETPLYTSAVGYKFILTDADDAQVDTWDNIENVGQVFAETFGLVMSGGSKNVVSGYAVLDSDRLVTVDSTGGANPCVITLPDAADALLPVTIKNLGTVALAITPTSGDTIESLAAVYTVAAASSPTFPTVTLVSDGVSAWLVTSSHGL